MSVLSISHLVKYRAGQTEEGVGHGLVWLGEKLVRFGVSRVEHGEKVQKATLVAAEAAFVQTLRSEMEAQNLPAEEQARILSRMEPVVQLIGDGKFREAKSLLASVNATIKATWQAAVKTESATT